MREHTAYCIGMHKIHGMECDLYCEGCEDENEARIRCSERERIAQWCETQAKACGPNTTNDVAESTYLEAAEGIRELK